MNTLSSRVATETGPAAGTKSGASEPAVPKSSPTPPPPDAEDGSASSSLGAPAAVPYFLAFEHRTPPTPVPASTTRDFIYQALATAAIGLGVYYLFWRWTASLNLHVFWFSIPLVVAETLAFIGSLLFFLSIWRMQDAVRPAVPATLNDILEHRIEPDRPLIVDVFFPTYNEDIDLVRLSIEDAKRMTYPHPIDVRIHVLDDGKRPAMKLAAEQAGVGYLTRASNIGFKAGNMRNGMEHTQGDLVVICDADTRPFPYLLEEVLGYFRDPQVAWVQTPQWFFDLEEGTRLPMRLARFLGAPGRLIGRGIERIIGPVRLGADPLGNDPQLFYDVIQRRRNWCNGAFCCGAGSVHRREAVMEAALKGFAAQVEHTVGPVVGEIADLAMRADLTTAMTAEVARDIELTPYKFHVSEDIYTSIILHGDPERKWRSIYHPRVVTKMLSPQDLLTWSIQRFKYAGGTLDIFRNDNPLRNKGLSPWQKLTYGATVYSYFAPLWTVVFLLSPAVYFLTGWTPVTAYGRDFYAHFIPFLVVNKLAFMAGTWGVNGYRGEQYYLAFFWLNIKALRDVLLNRPIKFHVTPKTRQAGNYYALVWPHLSILGLSVVGAIWMGLRIGLLGVGSPSAYVANLFWTLNNALSLWVIISAARGKALA